MANVAKTIAQLRRDLNLKIRRIVLEVQATLVATPPVGTPRDTGHATSNWVPRLNTPYRGEGAPGADAAAQMVGVAKILTTKNFIGKVVWISNNVPYIRKLNNGWSKQSPQNFVQRALQLGLERGKRNT